MLALASLQVPSAWDHSVVYTRKFITRHVTQYFCPSYINAGIAIAKCQINLMRNPRIAIVS